MAAVGVDPLVGGLESVPNPLSKRQLEVVSRAARGSSNEEIANSLFISRRTVENHLHRVYSTLQLSDGRDELFERFGWIS
jgi:DNA-binding NarL/FixJ family response regulator